MESAVKVGVLVAVFIALFIGAYFALDQALFTRRTMVIHAEFADAGGTTVGTPVLMAGVQVGTVKRVGLVNSRTARITMTIDRDHPLPEGTVAEIPGALIGVGEQPAQLVPPDQPVERFLPEDSVIPGRRASPLEALLPNAKDALDELTATLAASRRLLEDEELRTDIHELLRTTAQTVETAQGTLLAANRTLNEFGGIATETQILLAQNRLTINRAVTDAALAVQNVRDASDQVARLLRDGRFEGETLALLETLNRTTLQAERLIGNLDQFLTDPEIRQPLARTVQNFEQISESGTRIAGHTEVIAERGAVVADRAIELTEKATEVAEEARRVLQQVGGFFGRTGTGRGLPNIEAEMNLSRQFRPGYWRTDFNFGMPLPDGRLHVGLFDAFESNRINVQLGRPFGASGHYRYGIYASKPGAGVDYEVAPRVSVHGDLYDINNLRADFRVRYDFGRGLAGWVGMDRVFERATPTIGIGVRR
jgi:phospholipid/cholesterol/gamma-HCH transport system substrate-binding protein